jgi:hypothetical protein
MHYNKFGLVRNPRLHLMVDEFFYNDITGEGVLVWKGR